MMPLPELYNAGVFSEETGWSVFDHGRPITRKKFIRMLGKFEIKPTKRRKSNVFYGANLDDAYKRYL